MNTGSTICYRYKGVKGKSPRSRSISAVISPVINDG